ncbi:FMN-dependent NADH-azoreductase [Shimia ponticola]|uniref:FMN-dependent NADH-azoreductase n=1 Tax=Shimia ponticola TaxID=2582893 RepID=UPI0011BEDE19|nr:NAD(P)H-dependent oxidoreductase [Shimia ponticola]
MSKTVLRIDSSARLQGSITRKLADQIISQLAPAKTITRDLAHGVPLISEAWVNANFTPADQRTDAQKAELAVSDEMVAELKEADTLVIGVPIYNFSVPAALKAWIDQIARAGITFKYSETGPKGLLEGKRAIVVVASGGTKSGSDIDFATDYIRHVMGFIGIEDVDVIAADQMALDPEATLAGAETAVRQLAA